MADDDVALRSKCRVLVRKMLVNDLKLVLKSFSLSTSGRKQCLQTRVLHLIDTHKEVARVEQAILASSTRRRSHTYHPPPKPHHVPSLDPLTGMPLYSGLPNLVPPTGLPSGPFERKPNRVPVVFHHLTYAQRKQMILAPEMLESHQYTFARNSMTLQLVLTPEHRRLLTDGAHKAHLRFCCNDTKAPQKDAYPIELRVTVNGIRMVIEGYNPDLCRYPEYMYHCHPIDITKQLRLSVDSSSNWVEVTWRKSFLGTSYVVCIELTREVGVPELVQQLKGRVWEEEKTEDMIKCKLARSKNSDVVATSSDSLIASLLCPLGKMRMSLPCRGTKCSHIQCFDASLYLEMNSKRESWKCPVCNSSLPYEMLVVDRLFSRILDSPASQGVAQVRFDASGDWTPVQGAAAVEEECLSTPVKQRAIDISEIVDLTSSPTSSTATTVSIASPVRDSTPSQNSDDVIVIV